MDIEEIYKEYHDKILYYIKSKVNNPEDAEDICSDVFMKVQGKLAEYDETKSSIATWIYTIARNRVVDHYRTHKDAEEIPEELSSDFEVDEALLNRETLSELADALMKLSEDEREIIILCYYQGLTLKEIERRTGMTYGQVKWKHNSALNEMKKFLSKRTARSGFYVV